MFTVIMSALLGFLPAMPGMCDGVVHPQFHDAINGLWLSHALLQREDCFIDHRA